MAVTPPTPPTPPTAPKVPAVTLNDGGSVTDSTVPVSGYQSAADAAENQAKQAVAKGDGSLTKTTQEKPAAKADSKTQLAKADADNKINQSDDKAAPLAASENDAADNTGTLVQQPEPMAGYNHTTIYWLFTVISILFLAIVVWQLIKRKLTSKAVDANQVRTDSSDDISESREAFVGFTAQEALKELTKEPKADDTKHFEVRI